jgi:hypothetical protein
MNYHDISGSHLGQHLPEVLAAQIIQTLSQPFRILALGQQTLQAFLPLAFPRCQKLVLEFLYYLPGFMTEAPPHAPE